MIEDRRRDSRAAGVVDVDRRAPVVGELHDRADRVGGQKLVRHGQARERDQRRASFSFERARELIEPGGVDEAGARVGRRALD